MFRPNPVNPVNDILTLRQMIPGQCDETEEGCILNQRQLSFDEKIWCHYILTIRELSLLNISNDKTANNLLYLLQSILLQLRSLQKFLDANSGFVQNFQIAKPQFTKFREKKNSRQEPKRRLHVRRKFCSISGTQWKTKLSRFSIVSRRQRKKSSRISSHGLSTVALPSFLGSFPKWLDKVSWLVSRLMLARKKSLGYSCRVVCIACVLCIFFHPLAIAWCEVGCWTWAVAVDEVYWHPRTFIYT